MKKVSFVLFSVVFIFSVVLPSCDKDSADKDNTGTAVYLPKKMYGTAQGDQWNATFAYDDQNRLIRATAVNREGGDETVIVITYPAANECVIKNYYGGETQPNRVYTAKETGNVIEVVRGDYYAGADTYIKDYYYTVADGRITEYHNTGEVEIYTYDASGNITQIGWSGATAGPRSTTCEYDNKKGIFSNINTPEWILWDVLDIDQIDDPWFFVNNITKLYRNEVLDVKYEYTYNSDGYPSAINITEYDEDEEEKITVTIEY